MVWIKSVVIDKKNSDKAKKRLVLGCGALVYDLLRLIKQNPTLSEKVNLQCLPASWHNSPQLIAPGVEDYLSENAHLYEDIYIAYADCGTGGALDRVIEKYDAKRIGGAHCYEFFAGSEVFEQLSEEELGTFYLTDYLVKNFHRIMIKGLQYKYLINHSSHKINLISNTSNSYIYRIEIITNDKKLFFYEWQVQKGSDGDCKNCWFTSAVSLPLDQGNTI